MAILKYLAGQGKTTIGFKPIASGCTVTAAGLRNDDALQLQAAATLKLTYQQVNPFAFEPAIAPHIAADLAGSCLSTENILQAFNALPTADVDYTLIEGAGCWLVQLNAH